jgi:O-antigen/teichoic acid export membrane protein
MKEIIIYTVPIMISMLAYTIISNFPTILIKHFYNYELVGIYTTSMTIATIFNFIPVSIVTITMPTISNIESKIEAKTLRIKYTSQSLKIVLVTGIILYALIIIFGRNIIELFFTKNYSQSYPILLILSIGAIFGGLRNVFCSLWEGMGVPIISTYDIITASLICSILSYLLIPYVGLSGAAYGYSFGLISSVIVDIIFWLRYKGSHRCRV